MSEKAIVEQIKDTSERAVYHLDRYMRTRDVRQLQKHAFWARATWFWTQRFTEVRILNQG